ncbi:MAG: hypothetical protein OEZ16_13535 [Chromatiales bacterium]|nr:hypothetical protein [Chromatiales bacterium]
MQKRLIAGLMVASSLLMAGCQTSPIRGSGSVSVKDGPVTASVSFSNEDRRHIHGYYSELKRHGKKKKSKGLPPGLAKRDRLPPGLAKRDRLPPGLSGDPLPRELERKLSRLPDGVVRVRVGTDIVLMNGSTRVVLDMVKDIPLD